ncbi:MAG: hypothetical protein AAFS10_08840 [Myxococcota bacterium]
MKSTSVVLSCIGLVWCAGALGGCEASFEDLRPGGEPLTVDPLADDPLTGNTTTDGSTSDDTTMVLPEPGEELLVLQGQMEDQGYDGEGTVSLYLQSDGTYVLRFGDDFLVDSVPGPVVVMTVEDSLGSRIDPERGDLELGPLERDSGPSSYALPFAPGPRMWAWVYCKPFGLDVSRARLMEP